MHLTLKTIAATCSVVAVGLITATAWAANFTANGTVKYLYIENDATNNVQDYVQLNGLTSLGASPACATNDGLVSLKLPHRVNNAESHKAMVSTLTSAKLAGRSVAVSVTNSTLTDGYCTLRWVTIE
jgi:hypothetical protein